MEKDLINQIQGVIYGQAIGDALGLGTEFMTKTEAKKHYPRGLHHYEQIVQDEHRQRWQRGAWTDDTDQMLCILDSLLEKHCVDIQDIASRIYNWAMNGGMGLGETVASVLMLPNFHSNPHQASQAEWHASGKFSAANGGVMRTSILGVWDYKDPKRVKHNAESVCKITHYDPRCTGSCVLICSAISAILRNISIDTILYEAHIEAKKYDPRISEYLEKAQSLEDLELDEGLDLDAGMPGKIGYTLKTMGAAFWALQKATSYENGISKIIQEGGDADSNAAVAGALLGAKFGFSSIPQHLIDNLLNKASLASRLEQFIFLLEHHDS